MTDKSTSDDQQSPDRDETAADTADDHTAEAATESTTEDGQSDTEQASTELDDLKAERDKWKALARKHETNAKSAKDAEQELTQLREQVANHDVASVQAASSLAAERLHTKLARAGVSEQDAAALAEHIDPMTLLDEGEPSSEAIEQVATSLSRSANRSVADSDQGQRSSTPAFSADEWLRRKARNN